MQQPTLRNVRIRSTRDALQVFNGVALNRLPLITRRLDAEERRAIVPGNVYVWEERGANTEPTGLGMERWTDGMGWGPSRVRDEFLFYHQKEADVNDDLNPVTPWAQLMRRSSARLPNKPFSLADQNFVPESERLIKQTYSVHVFLPADRARGISRKWHLTAYFSQHKLDELGTIDKIHGVGDIPVPDGWFKSARTVRPRRDSRTNGGHPQPPEVTAQPSASPPYNYARLPPQSNSHHNRTASSSHLSVSPTPSSNFSSSAPSPSTPNRNMGNSASRGQLVPLEYLQNISAPRRDPTDEQLLRRFAS